jgi:hypothetical protein
MKTIQEVIVTLFPTERTKLSKIWQNIFDPHSTALHRKPIIDIVKLDDELKRVYKDEYTDDMSMQEFLSKKFPEKIKLGVEYYCGLIDEPPLEP